MKALATALLVLVAACGEGRVILNVDVLSFLSSSDSTKPYNVPGVGVTVDSSIVRRVIMPPGLGSSIADSVSATAAAIIQNATGAGSITFSVFFAKTQGALFTGTPYVSAASGPISGAQTVQLVPPTTVSVGDTVFNTDSLWVGIRARITTNVGPNMTGQLRITTLGVRVVVQDKVF